MYDLTLVYRREREIEKNRERERDREREREGTESLWKFKSCTGNNVTRETHTHTD